MHLEYFNFDSDTDDIIKALELNGAAVVENQVCGAIKHGNTKNPE